MSVVHQPLLPLTPPHNTHDSGIWFLALLVSTYALPFTNSGQLVDSIRVRTSGFQAHLPVRKTQQLGKRSSDAGPSRITNLRPLDDWPESGTEWGTGLYEIREGDGFSTERYTSLSTLKQIQEWARENIDDRFKFSTTDATIAAPTSKFQHNVKFTNPTNHNTSSALIASLQKRIVRPYDKKVFVYGKDDRLRIFPHLLRKFPYSNIVRLSTGCTGTLVTPIHVLTAAHCVHTGHSFRNNLEMLKVEIPDTMGDKIYYIEKIGIPSKWLHPGKYEHQEFWDYAVVKLSYGIHGRSQFFPLAVPTANVLNQNLQFMGFPNNEYDLWMSVCPANSNKAMVDGNLILTRCDSAVGNSGAAVLSDEFREGKKIIGVLSSTMPVGRMPPYTPFSLITALTWTKLHDICAEIGEIGVLYRVCPRLKSIPRFRRIDITNKVIPFFG